jgi:carbon-monoxide dehydrogenase medium subunit
MKMWKNYYIPASLDEAIELLVEPRSQVVAGATDLMIEIKGDDQRTVETLIDITRIQGLNEIRLDDEGWIHLGPLVTHNDCADSSLVIEKAFALANASWQVGSPQIRTRGTVAGNIISASPANDTITPLIALGANLTLRSIRGERIVSMDQFYQGVRKTVMEEDELLVDIAFPALLQGASSSYYKLALRRAHAISVANAAAVIHRQGDLIQKASVTMGAVAPTIVHAIEAEEYLVGKKLTPEVIEQAAALAVNSVQPISDIRGSASYRRSLVKVCVERSLKPIAVGTEREDFPARRVRLEKPGRKLEAANETTLLSPDSTIQTTVNGKKISVENGCQKTLLDLLRENLLMTGTKEGCSEGECGSCTVFLDDQAVLACLVPAPRAHGAVIRTLEGVADGAELHPVQQEFIEEGAVQCGFCTPGFIMSGVMLLDEIEDPSLEEIKLGVSGNLCRCTGYYKILSAIHKAAQAGS